MKKIIGFIVLVLLLAIRLTGCTNAPEENGNEAALESTKVTESQTSSDTAEWPRTYVDSAGNEIILDKQPARVISVFHAMYPDYLYALDIYPIGVASADTLLSQWAAYKAFTEKQPVIDIGAVTALDFEQILKLEPDLILASSFNEASYEQLSKIAPTVILDYSRINSDWKYGIDEFAKLFGKEAQTEELIANVEGSIKNGSENLEAFRSKNESVIFISITEKDIWPYTVEQLQVIYNEETGLGLKAPDGYSDITDRSSAISLEVLAQYNPDHIFIMTDYGDEAASQWLEELSSNPVWTSISAIKADHIYFTDRSIFAFNSPIATQYGVNLVVESLSE